MNKKFGTAMVLVAVVGIAALSAAPTASAAKSCTGHSFDDGNFESCTGVHKDDKATCVGAWNTISDCTGVRAPPT